MKKKEDNFIKTNSYKFRAYPNRNQVEYFGRAFGCVRSIYNNALETMKTAYESTRYFIYEEEFKLDKNGNKIKDENGNYKKHFVKKSKGRSYSKFDISKELKVIKQEAKFSYFKEIHSIPLVVSVHNLADAYDRFFKGFGKYPQFKRKYAKNSFSFHQGYSIDFQKSCLLLPKVKDNELKVVFHREIKGTPKTCTISMDSDGKYWVSLCCEVEPFEVKKKKIVADKVIGIDVNVDGFYDSDGNIYETPRPFKKYKERLAFLQQRKKHMTKKSLGWVKQKKKIAKLHSKIARLRKDWLHNLTHDLTTMDGVTAICLEDLNVSGMTKSAKGTVEEPGKMVKQKSGLNRSLLDVSFGEFKRQLEYKCKRTGVNLFFADRFFASSKTCNNCGEKNLNLSLKDREWTCEYCEMQHQRDFNAAVNIKNYCMDKYLAKAN